MNELPRDLNDILEAFPEFLKDEAREVLEHWDDEGFCGFAQIMGMADRDEMPIANRIKIIAMLKRAHPDGFAKQYARMFGLSVEEAHVQAVAAVNDARRA
jgi:hypothetical protein